MRSSRIRGSLTAVVVLIAFLAQGTWTLAGTTGTLTGTLANAQTGAPLSGVKVSVTSPSTTSSSTTDATGHFTFLALPPDTYLVSAAQSGYEPVSISGVTVLADQTRQLPLTMTPSLRVIARVTSRAATDLVKPGTTADVYSINATMQDKVSAMGGGGNINSAWSAIATVPGVFVQPGQNGYIGAGATFSIRGGDYDQVGFEIDGVPVNRAFDNYPSGPASSLGQQELQVYTGAAPASAEAQGLSGFINQVIRTGTYPAFGQATASVGGAAFYHKIAAEAGGATPTRNFSYYVGLGGYNQDFRFYDNFNGASLASMWGPAISVCDPSYTIQVAPSCFTNGQYNGNTAMDPLGFGDGKHGSFLLGPNLSSLGGIQDSASNVQDRDSIVNFHFAFPHKNGTKDDLQLLGVITALQNGFSTSTNDLGGAALLGGPLAPTVGLPTWFDGIEYHGPSGVPLPANYQALTAPYYFPSSPTNRPLGAPLPANLRDTSWNDQAISKLQYTHQMGDNAFLRVYGYMYYSDWILAGGPCGYMSFNYFFCPNAPDYELSSHTRGASAQFVDQITPQHLVTLQGSYTTATTIRNNNTEMYDTSTSSRRYLAVLVDSTAPTNGLCYTSAGVATTCYAVAPYQAAFATKQQALAGTIPAATGTCGGGPCEWFVVNPGPYATYNHVAPQFSSFSLTDQWRPTNKLSVDAGIRYDRYSYVGENTNTGPARTLFYNAFNLDTCLDANNNLYDKIVKLHLATPSAPCPAGFTAANFTNPSGQTTQSFPVWQPRLGVTYTLNPTSVVRASYGRFTQAPNSAFELYDTLQPNAPYYLYNVFGFQKFGFTSPAHNIPAASSNNFDLSLEHQFPNQWSTKLTPFYRRTQNQIQQFYL
ncbi:MAG: TonB-dependent receptor, partial [Candidatus Eremiobacteraeota bacterium]|nr:TonB-dependent receptor [Candidatus Eremiobacteraeota bacterium]